MAWRLIVCPLPLPTSNAPVLEGVSKIEKIRLLGDGARETNFFF